MNEVREGIEELMCITPIMHDVLNDETYSKMFANEDVIPINKDKYNEKYNNTLNNLMKKGFKISIM